jgi:hypothetical protein
MRIRVHVLSVSFEAPEFDSVREESSWCLSRMVYVRLKNLTLIIVGIALKLSVLGSEPGSL